MRPLHRTPVTVLHGTDKPVDLQGVSELAKVRFATGEELAKAIKGAEVLFVWDFNSTALEQAWPHANALRWVHAASSGVNHVLFPELVDSEIMVTNSRGVFDQSMAEYVLGLILAFAKDLPNSVRLQEKREWRHRESRRIAGARAVVVGTGPIGRAIGRTLGAVGMSVTGVGRTAATDDPDLGTVYPLSDLGDALRDADYLVLAAPLTPATDRMIGKAALACLRPSAYLINVGRGQLVVEPDVIEALEAGALAGAALDVFEHEPLDDGSPLWEMPNVIISPHMSGDAQGWRAELVTLFADNLARYRDGRRLRNVVDKRIGYVRSGSQP